MRILNGDVNETLKLGLSLVLVICYKRVGRIIFNDIGWFMIEIYVFRKTVRFEEGVGGMRSMEGRIYMFIYFIRYVLNVILYYVLLGILYS